jgi:hypothetical protein
MNSPVDLSLYERIRLNQASIDETEAYLEKLEHFIERNLAHGDHHEATKQFAQILLILDVTKKQQSKNGSGRSSQSRESEPTVRQNKLSREELNLI